EQLATTKPPSRHTTTWAARALDDRRFHLAPHRTEHMRQQPLRQTIGGPHMSTNIYLQCDNHNPPIRSTSEVGQHLTDLKEIRNDLAHRDTITKAVELDYWPEEGIYHFRTATARFLRDHPHCTISIWDQYGKQHPLEEPETDDQ